MLDPNLKGAESGDPTFMWCASLVTHRRASLSHTFEGEEGVVWAGWSGWEIHRQQLIQRKRSMWIITCMDAARSQPAVGRRRGKEGSVGCPHPV